MVHATVIGARGYLGRELLRLLHAHPEVETVTPVSRSQAGQPVADSIPALAKAGWHFHDAADPAALEADVVFLATPSGEAAAFVAAHETAGAKTIIDLSRDHRLQAIAGEAGWKYGMSDLVPIFKGTARIANPGCYPTAAMLAIAPALHAGLQADGPIIVDGKSGVSGAGVAPRADLHFPEMNESVRAYKVLGHDHTAEMAAAATHMSGSPQRIRFTPHLVPQTRGLLCTAYIPTTASADAVQAAYQSAYHGHAFVRYGVEPDTGVVRRSNQASVRVDVDEDTGLIIARAAIDNLLKGGSGTAVQNMNHALGFAPEAGLSAMGGL